MRNGLQATPGSSLIAVIAERMGWHFVIGGNEPPMPALVAKEVNELADAAATRLKAEAE